MMSLVYRARAVQPGTAMTAHGDEVRCLTVPDPFLSTHTPSATVPALPPVEANQIYLRVTPPTQNSEQA